MIELLVVVTIIAILASMLLPALANARERGRQAYCLNNLKQIALASISYTDDYQGYMKPTLSVPNYGDDWVIIQSHYSNWMTPLFYDYLGESFVVFECPSQTVERGGQPATPYAARHYMPGYALNFEVGFHTTTGVNQYIGLIGRVKDPSHKLWHGDAIKRLYAPGTSEGFDTWYARFRNFDYSNSATGLDDRYGCPNDRHLTRANMSFFDGAARPMRFVEMGGWTASNTSLIADDGYKFHWDLNANDRSP